MLRFLTACTLIVLLTSSLCMSANLNVVELGAVPDGVTDNTAVFQKALDEAGKDGSIVNVPAGKYKILGNLSIPRGVTMQGTYRSAPYPLDNDPTKLTGSVLLAYAGRGSEKGAPFIELDHTSTVAGFIVTYPEWKKTDVPPVPYPPCIAGKLSSENVAILDCCLLNAYEGIKLYRSHRFLVRNIHGYPIKRGIFVDECYDIGRIENIHFWPFGIVYTPDDPYCKWINLNGVAFEFARTDWQYVTNTFCFGYGVGYKFSEYKEGGCNGNFLGIGADSCQNAVIVDQAQPPGLLITNGEFVGRWSSMNAVTFVVNPKVQGKVSLNNCSFWGPIDQCVTVDSPNGQFTATGCNFLHYDINGTGSPAVRINAGSTILQGNTFGEGQLQVAIGKKVKSAVVMGNQAPDGIVIENNIGRKAQILGNSIGAPMMSAAAFAAYTLDIGSLGDSGFIKHWSGREPGTEWAGKGTKRWSTTDGQLILPVLPNAEYSITMDINLPKYALAPNAGIYLGKTSILKFTKEGPQTLSGTFKSGKATTIKLDIKCRIWIPKEEIVGSNDARKLGVGMRSVTIRAKGSKNKLYLANTGEPVK